MTDDDPAPLLAEPVRPLSAIRDGDPADFDPFDLAAAEIKPAAKDCKCGRCGPTGLLWGNAVLGERHIDG